MPLYKVSFNEVNEPVEVKELPLLSGIKHGHTDFYKRTLFTKWVCVHAKNEEEALQTAKELAKRRLETKE